MSNKYHIGRDPSCFGNVYCGNQLIIANGGGGISDALAELVDSANRGFHRPATEQPVEYLCNRQACRAEGATQWNPSTRAYYCDKCAKAINEGVGYRLCIPLTSKPLPCVQNAPYHKEHHAPEWESQQPVDTFQQRVQPWVMECFGAEIAADKVERNHRFIEEALELVQSCGATASECHQLVDYVFGRPVGEPYQESGGVMVTHAALCLANGLDMHDNGEVELARIWTKVEKIRAKQAAKPKHSPLPQITEPIYATEEAKLKFLARQLATAAYDYLENPAQPLIAFVDNCWMQYLNQAKYALPLLQLPKRESVALSDDDKQKAIDVIADALYLHPQDVAAALPELLEHFELRRRHG